MDRGTTISVTLFQLHDLFPSVTDFTDSGSAVDAVVIIPWYYPSRKKKNRKIRTRQSFIQHNNMQQLKLSLFQKLLNFLRVK